MHPKSFPHCYLSIWRSNAFLFLLVLIAMASCREESEGPVIAPSLVIEDFEIVKDGTYKVAARVEDIGSLPISEHGFLFADQPNLDYPTDILWKSQDEADEIFETTFEEALAKDSVFYLQAFAKTAAGISVSPIFTFKSTGLPPYVVERITYPDSVYFGDTVVVHGKYFPKSLEEIQVKFGYTSQYAVSLTDSTFGFVVPYSMEFREDSRKVGFPFSIIIGAIRTEHQERFNFRYAKFPPLTEVSMAELWKLPGQYLYGQHLHGLLVHEEGGYFEQYNPTDTLIQLRPVNHVWSRNPKVQMLIRDSLYTLDHIRVKKAEFLPGQKVTINQYNQLLTVNSRDFNVFSENYNSVIADDPDLIHPFFTSVAPDQVSFHLGLKGPLNSRKFNVYSYNFEEKGTVPLEVTYSLPVIPIGYAGPPESEIYSSNMTGFLVDNVIHLISPFGNFGFDLKSNTHSWGAYANNSFVGLSSFRVEFNGKLYFSNSPIYSGVENATQMFVYNPATKTTESSNYLPLDGHIVGSFVSGNRMFYQVVTNESEKPVSHLFAWNGNYNSAWEKISSTQLDADWLHSRPVDFQWQGQNFRFVNSYDLVKEQALDKFERFNTQTYTWEFVKSFPFRMDGEFLAFPSEKGVYLTNGIKFYLFNPVNFDYQFLGENRGPVPAPKTLVYKNGSFYYLSDDALSLVQQLDIALLKP